jgi:hypothetical protein
MQLTSADFRKHYAEMSDDELERLDRATLGEVARDCYDREIAYRASAEYRDKQLKAAQESEVKALAEARRCFFCGAEPVSPATAAHIEMHSDYEQKSGGGNVTHKWIARRVPVARCPRCLRVHRTERNIRILAGILSLPLSLFAVLAVVGVAGQQVGPFALLFAPIVWYGILFIGSSFAAWLLYLLPSNRGTKPIHHAYKSIAVSEALRDGWGKGAPLTFSFDLKRMFRKFIGLIELPAAP